MSSAGPAVALPAAATLVQPAFPGGGERIGQFSDEPVQMVAGDPGEGRMRQGRTGLLDPHNQQTVQPFDFSIKPPRGIASIHHY